MMLHIATVVASTFALASAVLSSYVDESHRIEVFAKVSIEGKLQSIFVCGLSARGHGDDLRSHAKAIWQNIQSSDTTKADVVAFRDALPASRVR